MIGTLDRLLIRLQMWFWNRTWNWRICRAAWKLKSRVNGHPRAVCGCRSWAIILEPWPRFSYRILPWHWVLHFGFVTFSFNRFAK